MTSPGYKVGQIWHCYISSIFQLEHRSKAQNIGNAHDYFVGIFNFQYYTSVKKVGRELKMAAILKYETQHQFDLRYEKIVPNYTQNSIFHGDDVIDDVAGRPESCRLYSCLGEVGSGSKLRGQCLVNKCEYRKLVIVFLGYTCLKKISINNTFWDRRSKGNVTGLLGDLGS